MSVLLEDAKKKNYAVPAPNCFNRESIEACFLAAKELRSPVILDVAASHGIEENAWIVRFYEKKYPEVPAALNLDHGGPFEDIILALRAGFSSVMIDRSDRTYEENVKEVKEVVKIAHSVGVTVEAELGHVGQGNEYEETRDSGLTHPEEAAGFVKETGIDCLAVSIGTSHGTYKGTPYLDFELLQAVEKETDLPLVLHGGSATGDDNLKKTICLGIRKINLFTDLSMAGIGTLREYLSGAAETAERKAEEEFLRKDVFLCEACSAGAKGYQEKLMHYMRVFNSEGKW